MAKYTVPKTPHTQLADQLFAPLEAAYLHSLKPHDCPVISDIEHARLSVHRCLSESTTGHGFLQYHADQGGAVIAPNHFFKSLGSSRRCANLASINHNLREIMAKNIPDPFAIYPELKKYHIYAGDGHYHHAAAFDPKPNKKQNPDTTAKTLLTGHFFRLDLRSHHIAHLDNSSPKDGKKSEHYLTLIKRIDASDERNQGIISDHLCVSKSTGQMLRRIIYIDPRDGTMYRYVTSEMQLPAHLIVIIYKQRWDIEKTFHQCKSKLFERKS